MWENYVKSYERENVGDKNASQRGDQTEITSRDKVY